MEIALSAAAVVTGLVLVVADGLVVRALRRPASERGRAVARTLGLALFMAGGGVLLVLLG